MKTAIIFKGLMPVFLFFSFVNAQEFVSNSEFIFKDTLKVYQGLSSEDSIWSLQNVEGEEEDLKIPLTEKSFYFMGMELDSLHIYPCDGTVYLLPKNRENQYYAIFSPLLIYFRYHENRPLSHLRLAIDTVADELVLVLEWKKFRTCDYNGFYTEVDFQLKFYGKQQRVEYHYGPRNYRGHRYAGCDNFWKSFYIKFYYFFKPQNSIEPYSANRCLIGNPDSVSLSSQNEFYKIDTLPRLNQVYSMQLRHEPYLNLTESTSSSLDIRIQPNPSSNYSTLEGLERGSGVAVYNALGQVLEGVWDGNQTLNWQGLPAGFYFVEIYQKGQKEVLKVLVSTAF